MPPEPRDEAHAIVRPLLRVRQFRAFTEEPPSDAELGAIADAARWSGSSTNSQPWRFIVTRDRSRLLKLHDAGLPQTRSLSTAPAAVLIVLPDDSLTVSHAYDEGRAAERMLIAAQLLGLGAGIAWVRKEVRPLVGLEFGIPDGWFVRTIVAIGHPTEAALAPKNPAGKARLPRNETVFEERWPAEEA
ncbi:MAG TPA: nitroreductase family protein [Candidatus Limnocylindrales bacterium]|nr:nitroreductase family protein [Candidatus Limnocylindrales bacterium]